MSKAIRNMEVMVRSMKRAKEKGMSTDNCHASMYNDNLLVRHSGTLEGQRLTIERNYGSTDIVQRKRGEARVQSRCSHNFDLLSALEQARENGKGCWPQGYDC